jgi:ring-1,2-phenylacetyl-CoA epoxidase subunit PaaC
MNVKYEPLLDYTLRLADNALIIGQRLGEWCGHGPVLEQDMALTNLALDHIGQARSLYQYAAQIEVNNKSEDDFAYLRDAVQFRNVLLVEQPNGDFANTIIRQFLYDTYNFENYRRLADSNDSTLAAIAKKSLKEVQYHLRHSSEWTKRLGDGTAISHQKAQDALDALWRFHGELYEMTEADHALVGTAVDLSEIYPVCLERMKKVLEEATLKIPADEFQQSGGKRGFHSEHLGYILADLQFLQRAYPGQNW